MATRRSYSDSYRPLFEAALEEEIGIYIVTDSRRLLTEVLHELRRAEPAFAEIAILEPIVEGKEVIFLAKKATELVE